MSVALQLKVYWPYFLREGLVQIVLPKKSVTHLGPPALPCPPIVLLTQYVRIGTDKRIRVYWTPHISSINLLQGGEKQVLPSMCVCLRVSALWAGMNILFWASDFSTPFWTRKLVFTSEQIWRTVMDKVLRKCVYYASGEGLPRVNWVVLQKLSHPHL